MVYIATYKLDAAELKAAAADLHTFDRVLLSGTVYTSRDAAHKRIFELLDAGKEPPFPIQGATIYYAGPTGTPQGLAIGSCGPTTSGRMDPYAPRLLELGLAAMIGKGERNNGVKQALIRNKGVYLCAIGGAGALACQCIKECQVIAFEDLGCESVKRLTLQNFPLIVATDCHGVDIFTSGRETYQAAAQSE